MVMFAQILAGLGLLFVGLGLISQHLRQMAGRRVRRALRTATTSRWSGLLAGGLSGAIIQSSNAITLLTANLVHARALSLAQAIPVVAGANAGTAVLVFLATIDIRLVVMYLMAMVGLALHLKLDGKPHRRDWLWAALGLALMFLGLDFIKAAPAGLNADDWRMLMGSGLSAGMVLLVGLAVALVTQSASTSTILSVAALHGGFISFDGAFWMMAGANAGSGLAVLLSGSGLKGSGRQLCLAHVFVKGIGTLVGAAAWFAAYLATGVTPSDYVPPGHEALMLAVAFLLMQLAGALPVTMMRDRIARATQRLASADPVEQASAPSYIYDRAIEDTLNALNLSVMERDRLTRALPSLMPDLDSGGADHSEARYTLWAGHRSVILQTTAFLEALIAQGLDGPDLHQALNEQLILENLQSLQDTLHEFAKLVDGLPQIPQPIFNLSESLRTLAMLLADTAGDPGGDTEADLDALIRMTGDRGDMMERLRRQMTTQDDADGDSILQLLTATRLFERAVWLIRRLAIARRGQAAQEAAASVGALQGLPR
jgi:phosphate:Na+ symporter